MIEVKIAGMYSTKLGNDVEIYGFASDSGPIVAEGFFIDSKHMGQWDVETGKYLWKDDSDLDLVEGPK